MVVSLLVKKEPECLLCLCILLIDRSVFDALFFCLYGIKTIDMVGYHWSNLSKLIDFNAFKHYQHKGWDKVADG